MDPPVCVPLLEAPVEEAILLPPDVVLVAMSLAEVGDAIAMLSVMEEPIMEESVIEEPIMEESVIEESIMVEPIMESVIVGELIMEESVIEEPIIAEVGMAESIIDELIMAVSDIMLEPVAIAPEAMAAVEVGRRVSTVATPFGPAEPIAAPPMPPWRRSRTNFHGPACSDIVRLNVLSDLEGRSIHRVRPQKLRTCRGGRQERLMLRNTLRLKLIL